MAELAEGGLRKQTIRKTVSVLAMILDHHGVQPNPARDPRIKMPREDKAELNPPSAGDVLAVYELLPSAYRLPLLVLDATGMRVGELESLVWGDVDERNGRWRLARPKRRPGRPDGLARHPRCSRPSSRFARVTIACPTGRCSAALEPSGSGRR